MRTTRSSFIRLARLAAPATLALLPLVLAACSKGSGGY
jgi:hypothetical protein